MNIRLSFCDLRHCKQPKSKMFTQRSKKKGISLIGKGLWYISSIHTKENIDHSILMSKNTPYELKSV